MNSYNYLYSEYTNHNFKIEASSIIQNCDLHCCDSLNHTAVDAAYKIWFTISNDLIKSQSSLKNDKK